MTIVSTAALTSSTSSIVSEFSGGASSNVAMTIGIGLVKDSDSVFFRYADEAGEQPIALLTATGRPLTTLGNVQLVDVSLYEPGDEYNTLKLNLTLQSSAGTQVLVTAGLTTFWSMSIIGGLLEMLRGGDLTCPFNLDTWKGNKGKIKPCFGAVKISGQAMRNDSLYNALTDARADGDKQKVTAIMRDSVSVLHGALNVDAVDVAVEESGVSELEQVLDADF
tara:strand:+ start:277 stop:942 length:666 start_codon:yes stop_codon:yes gene_type:complete